jgi:alpha,alpha-trehalase
MLGLKENGENETMKNMVDNFAYLINTYGHIPNGNRSYYLSRSQPPFFALMVELLASVNGDSTYTRYLPALEKEYRYWTEFKADNGARKWLIATNGTKLFRYCDSLSVPRQESHKEDSTLFANILAKSKPVLSKNEWVKFRLRENKKPGQLYKHLRSGAESGWDFSSRWFADGFNIETIQTHAMSPVDLNCLIYKTQMVLAKAYDVSGDKKRRDVIRAKAKELADRGIQRYFFNAASGWFMDYNINNNKQGTEPTLAGMFPLFMKIATKEQAAKAATYLKKNFLKPGGVVTTLKNTGQQWDAPNGWAPLQWITIIGLENYGYNTLAKTIAERWIKLNNDVYMRTGKLMEKYNVIDTHLEAGGGEYPGQDGFGWTNGVLSALIAKYGNPVAVNHKPE